MNEAQANASPDTANRRAHARFEVAARVMYDLQRRLWVGFVRNLSSGGMLLRPTQHLDVGANYDFSLTLPGAATPLRVSGEVVGVCSEGTRIRFHAGQEHVAHTVRQYMLEEVIPVRAAEASRPHANPRHICELAHLYMEMNLVDQAMDTMRRALQERPQSTPLRECLARLWFHVLDARAGAFDATHAAWVDELTSVLEAPMPEPLSDLLRVAMQRLRAWQARRATYAAHCADDTLAQQIYDGLASGNPRVLQVVEDAFAARLQVCVQDTERARAQLAAVNETQAQMINELQQRLNQERAQHGQCLALLHAEQAAHQETADALRVLKRRMPSASEVTARTSRMVALEEQLSALQDDAPAEPRA